MVAVPLGPGDPYRYPFPTLLHVMRPCDQCGTPVDNSRSLCTSCESKSIPARDATAPRQPKNADIDRDVNVIAPVDTHAENHWALVFLGAALNGIPAAVLMILASRIVSTFTSFKMPMTTSVYIGIGVIAVFAVFGGLADILPVRTNKNGVTKPSTGARRGAYKNGDHIGRAR